MKLICNASEVATNITLRQDGDEVDILADGAVIATFRPDGRLYLYDLSGDDFGFTLDKSGSIEVIG